LDGFKVRGFSEAKETPMLRTKAFGERFFCFFNPLVYKRVRGQRQNWQKFLKKEKNMIALSLSYCFTTTYLNPPAMSKPLRFISPLLLLAFSLLLFACGKEEASPTVINGKVTDKKSGLPIEGAEIYVEFFQEAKNGNVLTLPKTIITNENGEFSHTEASTCDGIGLTTVTKKKYNTRAHLNIKCNQANDLDIKLVPKDGVLRLNVVNLNGSHDSIWIIIENPSKTIEAQGFTSRILLNEFPLVLLQGDEYVEIFDLTSEEFTKIYWGFENIFPTFPLAPFQDSVYLILNDTTNFVVSF
jgi:hypothetical protein